MYRKGKLDFMKLAKGRNPTILATSLPLLPTVSENFKNAEVKNVKLNTNEIYQHSSHGQRWVCKLLSDCLRRVSDKLHSFKVSPFITWDRSSGVTNDRENHSELSEPSLHVSTKVVLL